jgi:hypothetical protein
MLERESTPKREHGAGEHERNADVREGVKEGRS